MMTENTHYETAERLFSIPCKKLAIIMAILFIVTFSLFIAQANLPSEPVLAGNEQSHIFLLNSIVYEGRFDSYGYYLVGADRSIYKGKFYSNKPPGYSFFLTPAYFLYAKGFGENRPFNPYNHVFDTYDFMKYSNALISSLIIVLFALFLATFDLTVASIAFGVIAAAAATIFPAYTILATSIPLSILLSISSIFFFRLFKLSNRSVLFWTISLFCCAYAVIVDYSNAFLLLPLAILALKDSKLEVKFIVPLLIATLPICLLLWYNYVIFDNPFVLTYHYYSPPKTVIWDSVGEQMTISRIPHGIYGLLLSPSRGLFILSPIAIFGVLAFKRIWKERGFDLKITIIMCLTSVLILSTYSYWHGGHSMGYRHILIAAMIVASLSAFFFERASRQVKIIAVIILIFSCFTGILSFFIELDHELLMLTWKAEPADIHSKFYSELLVPFIKKLLSSLN